MLNRKQAGFVPQLRIGIHGAEATRDANGYRGRRVHIAPRIAAAAAPNERHPEFLGAPSRAAAPLCALSGLGKDAAQLVARGLTSPTTDRPAAKAPLTAERAHAHPTRGTQQAAVGAVVVARRTRVSRGVGLQGVDAVPAHHCRSRERGNGRSSSADGHGGRDAGYGDGSVTITTAQPGGDSGSDDTTGSTLLQPPTSEGRRLDGQDNNDGRSSSSAVDGLGHSDGSDQSSSSPAAVSETGTSDGGGQTGKDGSDGSASSEVSGSASQSSQMRPRVRSRSAFVIRPRSRSSGPARARRCGRASRAAGGARRPRRTRSGARAG